MGFNSKNIIISVNSLSEIMSLCHYLNGGQQLYPSTDHWLLFIRYSKLTIIITHMGNIVSNIFGQLLS